MDRYVAKSACALTQATRRQERVGPVAREVHAARRSGRCAPSSSTVPRCAPAAASRRAPPAVGEQRQVGIQRGRRERARAATGSGAAGRRGCAPGRAACLRSRAPSPPRSRARAPDRAAARRAVVNATRPGYAGPALAIEPEGRDRMARDLQLHAVVGDEAGERGDPARQQRLRAVEADRHDVHLRGVPAGVAHLGVEHRAVGGHAGDPDRAALQLRGERRCSEASAISPPSGRCTIAITASRARRAAIRVATSLPSASPNCARPASTSVERFDGRARLHDLQVDALAPVVARGQRAVDARRAPRWA